MDLLLVIMLIAAAIRIVQLDTKIEILQKRVTRLENDK